MQLNFSITGQNKDDRVEAVYFCHSMSCRQAGFAKLTFMQRNRQNISQKESKKGILLVNIGTPEAPTPKAVRAYLKQFLSDPRVIEIPRFFWFFVLRLFILPLRSRASAQKYKRIWTKKGSPLLLGSQEILRTLQEKMKKRKELVFALGMSYGSPSLAEGLRNLQKKGCRQIFVFPMYPQYSSASTGSAFCSVAKELTGWRLIPALYFLNDYHDHPGFISALAKSIRKKHNLKKNNSKKSMLLFSYHGLPLSSIQKGDPYYNQCHKTSLLTAQKLGLRKEDWQISFQSRFGWKKWLEPYTSAVLQDLPSRGVYCVSIVCPAFSVDCLETLEETNIENRKIFFQAGGESYTYIPCLNSSKEQIDLYKGLIERQTARADF